LFGSQGDFGLKKCLYIT